MKTFNIQTLGCKVNQYESEQFATLLRARGLREVPAGEAELRIVNTCSVTVQAASQSRQAIRRFTRGEPSSTPAGPVMRPRVIAVGCWATSNRSEAAALKGVDAVLTHQDDLAAELDRLLALWQTPPATQPATASGPHACVDGPPGSIMDDGWKEKDWTAAGNRTSVNKPKLIDNVNQIWAGEQPPEELLSDRRDDRIPPAPYTPGEGRGGGSADNPARANPLPDPPPEYRGREEVPSSSQGATSLPLLGQRVSGHQRAFLKVQDGCDAHCTYCIIPKLRPTVWSKSIEDAVEEARRLVDAGHQEIILTGIFLGAYGQPTALRRRQPNVDAPPVGLLVASLCKNVAGLKRLRLSSLEPGDLSDDLLRILASHEQVVPHFHLPLQSGSDAILRRMNRQYTRDDFLHMLDRIERAFDRPALTTDIIVGFPGEGDPEFGKTMEVVDRARFIHIHAFPFSPRPGTAAARWAKQFVHGPVVNERIGRLNQRGLEHSLAFRSQFLGEEVTVIAESPRPGQADPLRQGRCERYFTVWFEATHVLPGDCVRVRIEQVTPTRTMGQVVPAAQEVAA